MSLHLVPLLADAGIPMIVITWPAMVLLLLPIIGAEAIFIIKYTALPSRKVIWATTAANAASTIVGIPLTWCFLLICEVGLGAAVSSTSLGRGTWTSPLAQIIGTIFTSAWLAPVDNSGSWAVPLAALVLLIPFFFVSVWVERRVIKHFFPMANPDEMPLATVSEKTLTSAVWGANLLSYGFLFAFSTAWLIWGVLHR